MVDGDVVEMFLDLSENDAQEVVREVNAILNNYYASINSGKRKAGTLEDNFIGITSF